MRTAAVVFCALLSAVPAAAQGIYPPPDLYPGVGSQGNPYTMPPGGTACNPYGAIGCSGPPLPENHPSGTYTESFDFPQVFVGLECVPPSTAGPNCVRPPNDYLTYVSLKNQANEPNAATITVTWEGNSQPATRLFTLLPQARVSTRLNDWPEIPRDQIGVTVEVRMYRKGTAGIAMHSARDFWRVFTILEGR